MPGEDKRSIARILSRLTEVFERAGIETPRLDAEVLLGFCLGKERADLYRDLSVELTDEQIARVLELTGRRKRREPMAYIRGFREFWSLNFIVTPAVLVPRPETECLVEEIIGEPAADAELATMTREHRKHQGPLSVLVGACGWLSREPARHGELAEVVRGAAEELARHFAAHLAREEEVIFPAVRRLLDAPIDAAIVQEIRLRRGAVAGPGGLAPTAGGRPAAAPDPG